MDSLYLPNFGTGFSSVKSDVVLHLAQWQYWWWFWFAFVWSFYFFVISRAVRLRVMKAQPRINTSQRSHGKWGDFLACVLPAIWCLNILTNSSFILRLIEWQNESSLFTVRVRGRQWYWVYKFELRHVVDILSAPKNIGSNQWVVASGGPLEVSDSYLYAVRSRGQNSWLKSYWESYLRGLARLSKQAPLAMADSGPEGPDQGFRLWGLRSVASVPEEGVLGLASRPGCWPSKLSGSVGVLGPKPQLLRRGPYSGFSQGATSGILKSPSMSPKRSRLLSTDFRPSKAPVDSPVRLVNYSVKRSESLESSRFSKRRVSDFTPLLASKSFLLLDRRPGSDLAKANVVGIFANRERLLTHRPQSDQAFLVLKQKRYKRKKVIPERSLYFKSEASLKLSELKFADRPHFTAASFIDSGDLSPTRSYRLLKKGRLRDEDSPVSLSRRLLRTKKTLVIPAHVNLTIVTNSYDVVHSWFLPGLGVKLDCVPGRSTHHTFYCDNVGFFFGMCAEICGRYHHHMPIRICALPFEHFLIWWHHFGVSKMLYGLSKKRYESKYSGRAFSW